MCHPVIGVDAMTAPDLVAVDLTDDERMLMVHALNEFFGSAKRAKSLLTPVVGLSTTQEFRALVRRLLEAVDNNEPLSDLDWARALFLTEISWASDLVGAGIDFATTIRDDEAVQLLRSIQRKISNYERFTQLRDNAK